MNFEAAINNQTMELELPEITSGIAFGEQAKSQHFKRPVDERYVLRMQTKPFVIDKVSIDKHIVAFTLTGNRSSVEVCNDQDLLADRFGLNTVAGTGEAALRPPPVRGKIMEIIAAEGEEAESGSPAAIRL